VEVKEEQARETEVIGRLEDIRWKYSSSRSFQIRGGKERPEQGRKERYRLGKTGEPPEA